MIEAWFVEWDEASKYYIYTDGHGVVVGVNEKLDVESVGEVGKSLPDAKRENSVNSSIFSNTHKVENLEVSD